tara:strand:- start:723 stop:1391 length:669 start_codon:yes stop_codon:yes gene_type:complete
MIQSQLPGLTLALSKGRIYDETLPFLTKLGVCVAEDPQASRKLIIQTNTSNLRLLIVRASDVPTYVKHGAADIGIAGKDVLVEQGADGLYQPLDLKIAKCRMMVAAAANFNFEEAVTSGKRIMVATKYSNISKAHFAEKGIHVNIVKLYGSMELAPLVGLSDVIVDLVSSGATLRANNLKEVEQIMPISARLVVNRTALTTKGKILKPILKKLEEVTSRSMP